MLLITKEKTNRKFIVILIFLVVIVAVGILCCCGKIYKGILSIREQTQKSNNKQITSENESESIVVLSPNGGEILKEGESYTIRWKQKGLERWGNIVDICLIGFDLKGIQIPAIKHDNSICYEYFKEYLLSEISLTENAYQWTIPENISEEFEEPISLYKIELSIFDNLPSEGRSEWGGFITRDESDDYFSIISE